MIGGWKNKLFWWLAARQCTTSVPNSRDNYSVLAPCSCARGWLDKFISLRCFTEQPDHKSHAFIKTSFPPPRALSQLRQTSDNPSSQWHTRDNCTTRTTSLCTRALPRSHGPSPLRTPASPAHIPPHCDRLRLPRTRRRPP